MLNVLKEDNRSSINTACIDKNNKYLVWAIINIQNKWLHRERPQTFKCLHILSFSCVSQIKTVYKIRTNGCRCSVPKQMSVLT